MKKGLTLLVIAVSFLSRAFAQDCTVLGQNPGTAFPICGTQSFSQTEVKICSDRKVPGPCNEAEITDRNPYWYKFTCYTSGSLSFEITPVELSDDYDWQLFDITGHAAEDVYTDKNLFVACNWSGETGKTGASSAGGSTVVCIGAGQPLYSSMPNIVQGHEYLLLVSHFTATQSGYTLDFGGGTADITDPRIPVIEQAWGSCKGNQVMIKLNKPMKCASLAADGSDFSLSIGSANVIAANGPACSSGFDMDSVVITLDDVLPPGDYRVDIKKGGDANTLLDACGTEMPPASANFTIHQDVFAEFDYQLNEGCVQDTLNLFHDGANNVNNWNWQFDAISSGVQNPRIIFSTDGGKEVNLIVSNGYCSDTSEVQFNVPAKIDAAFESPEIVCLKDKAVFTDKSSGNIAQWQWTLGEGKSSTQQHPDPFNYNAPINEQTYRVSLKISTEKGCSDSAHANVVVVRNCSIAVPTAFTPNNDGRNDYLYPSNAFNAENLTFRVYNRFGQMIFESRDWRKKWDGNVNGQPQSSGTYVWMLNYTLKTTKKTFSLKGTTLLIR